MEWEGQTNQHEQWPNQEEKNLAGAWGNPIGPEEPLNVAVEPMCVDEKPTELDMMDAMMDSQQIDLNAHAHYGYTRRNGKNVKFEKLVDVIEMNDSWKINVKKDNLKSEEEQAKRRMQHRNC